MTRLFANEVNLYSILLFCSSTAGFFNSFRDTETWYNWLNNAEEPFKCEFVPDISWGLGHFDENYRVFCPLGKRRLLSLKIWLRLISVGVRLGIVVENSHNRQTEGKKDKRNVRFVIYVFKKGTWQYMKVQNHWPTFKSTRLLDFEGHAADKQKGAVVRERDDVKFIWMLLDTFDHFSAVHGSSSSPCGVLLSPTWSFFPQSLTTSLSLIHIGSVLEPKWRGVHDVWWAVTDGHWTRLRQNFLLQLHNDANYCHSLLPIKDSSSLYFKCTGWQTHIQPQIHLVFISCYPWSHLFAAELVEKRSWHIKEWQLRGLAAQSTLKRGQSHRGASHRQEASRAHQTSIPKTSAEGKMNLQCS